MKASSEVNLIFVPSFYAVMDELSKLTGRFFGQFISRPEHEGEWPEQYTTAGPHEK